MTKHKKPLEPSQVLLTAMLAESKQGCIHHNKNSQKMHRLAQTALQSEAESVRFLSLMRDNGLRTVFTKQPKVHKAGLWLHGFNQLLRIDRHLAAEGTRHNMTTEVFARKEIKGKAGPEDALGVLWPYVDGQYVPDVPTGWVEPWDQNPRKTFEEAGLRELADSIRVDGVQQPIVCRLTETIGIGSLRRPVLQIVMGERRWRASVLAERSTLPVIVRVGLSDKDALRLALVENLKRTDLNAMEEADSYRALLDAGYHQVEIAAQIGVSEGTISNALRLRKLPQSIRDMVMEGKLSGSHARALLRFEGFEAAQVRMAELAIEEGVSAKSLEKGVPFFSALHYEKLIGFPGCDLEAICKACPYNAYRQPAERTSHVCLRPSHIAELRQAQEAEQEARVKAALEEMERKKRDLAETTRRQQEAARNQAGQGIVNALTGGQSQKEQEASGDVTAEQEAGGAGVETAAAVPGTAGTAGASKPAAAPVAVVSAPALEASDTSAPPELFLRDLPYNAYASIGTDSAAECRSDCSDCPCKAEARYSAQSVIKSVICLDPKRHASLKAQQTRAAQKERKQAFGDTAERLFGLEVQPDDRRALALMLWKQFEYLPQEVVKKLLPTIADTQMGAILQKGRYEREARPAECWEALAALPLEQMLTLALRAPLLYELHTAIALKSDTIPMNRWYFGQVDETDVAAPAVPEPDEEPGEDTERVVTCAQCGQEIAHELLHTPVVEEQYMGQELESGVFLCGDDLDGLGAVCPECAGSADNPFGKMLAARRETAQAAAEQNVAAHAYQTGDVVEVNVGSLTNGGAKWVRAVVQENAFPAPDLRHDLIAAKIGDAEADTPITYRNSRYVRPVSAHTDTFEDPACRTCRERRAQVGGLCWTCLNAEAERTEGAIANL